MSKATSYLKLITNIFLLSISLSVLLGTALKIAEVIAEARQSNPSEINIKSFREEGEVGIHKTIFRSSDDEIILYHNAYNRTIFAQGALDTSQWISRQQAGLYTYKDYMEDIS